MNVSSASDGTHRAVARAKNEKKPESSPTPASSTRSNTFQKTYQKDTFTSRVSQVNPKPIDPVMLKTQRDLSLARQKLGAEQLAQKPPLLQPPPNPLPPQFIEQQKRIDAAEKEVKKLEALEAKQYARNPSEVERARFQVFMERLPALEQQYGKQRAAEIARQTYYNSAVWNGVGGAASAQKGQINAAGLPHDPKFLGRQTRGGYEGNFRTPDGQPLEMGHVLAGVDWELNGRGKKFNNPFDRNAVTVVGDLAWLIGDGLKKPTETKKRFDAEGDNNWNGDIDGLNIAERLKRNPNLGLAQAFKDYYGGNAYQRRVDEWAQHSKYFLRQANGEPARDKNGNYQLNQRLLQKDAENFFRVLNLGNDPGQIVGGLVIGHFNDWLAAHRAR
ncbi:hypothetical protein F0U60_47095 [Archangium minus]|uniref:Uncharacterized protein n=1 Tax=Archangium minus TaxID=83450 RepID=A0ABY9X628_9BACT|nr:hypothetical protein F0U60_47095 [Archangium minus]